MNRYYFHYSKMKLIIKYSIYVLVVSFWNGTLLSQNSNHFERITTDNGLSQSDINAIHQDKDGFMWFCTHDGLNRYDGYSFKIFKPEANNPNSISSNLIFDIEEDQNANLWIGTTGGGLVFFNRSTEEFTTYNNDPNNINSINSDYISTVYHDKENRLWIGTNNGLNMLDLNNTRKSIIFKRFKAQQEPFVANINIRSVNAIYEDTKGQVWIGGYGGLYKLSRESNGDTYFRYVNNDIGLPNVAVREIKEKNGRLLIATNNGLYIQSKNSNTLKVERVIEGSFNNLLIDKNIIWTGTENGLWKIEYASLNDMPQVTHKFMYDPKDLNSISKNNVISLFKDKTGIIWAGTNGGGVNKFDPSRKQFVHVRKTLDENSLSYDKIRSFYEDSNNILWVGTEGGGLNRLNSKHNYNHYLKYNNLKNVYAIEELKRGNKKYLLYGGQGNPSLFELDITNPNPSDVKKARPITEFGNSIFSLLKDSRGYLWIGTYNGGLYRWILDERSMAYKKTNFINDINDMYSISGNIIRNIFEDSNGNMWFATNNGLSMLSKSEINKDDSQFTVFRKAFNDEMSLSHNYILSIQEDKNNNIWVGTFGGGLNKLTKNVDGVYEVVNVYSEKNGLPNNVIKGILEDNGGNLWLSSNKGLSKFNSESEEFKNYDVNDGLQSNEFQELAYMKSDNGDFLFGGVNGFNVFQPMDLRDNTFIPETVITKFFVSNEEVNVGQKFDDKVLLNKTVNETEQINLKHFQNNISFEFAALHYAAPEKNKFKYKLEGFDNNWESTSASKRFAAYTNLAPGDYTFKVKASNNDGIWNDGAASIAILISPPFWMTWWAYVIYSLLIFALFWSIQSYFNLRSKQRASVELQREIEQVNKLKLQFFTNISHEFKTPITLILNPVEELLASIQNNSTIQSKLKVVQRNANSLLRLVHQLMEFRRIEVGETKLGATQSNIVSFVREITHSFQASAKKSGVNIFFKSESKKIDAWFDWDKLEKIMNNLIYNAIKFTPDKGEIVVRIKESGVNDQMHIESRGVIANYVKIEVEDNGVGMDRAQLPYVFQRFYQVNQSDKAAHKGSGIGLAITKDLVDLHHGDIQVASEQGKGTTFTIRLPLGKSHLLSEEIVEVDTYKSINEDAFDKEMIDEEGFTELETDIKDLKGKSVVLVVDDNADIRELVKDGLSEHYQIIEAEHGKEALHKALKEIPDLVITDVLMPEMDGVELTQEIKTNVRTSHIPVIMLTALNSVEHRIEGLESGADAYIPKPFKMKLLSVRVAKLIASRDLMRKRFQTEKEITPEHVTLNSIDEEFLKQIMNHMEENMGNEQYWVDELASDMNTSRSTFFRKLKKLTGQAPNDFMRMVRLKRAVQLLEQNELTIAQVSYRVGFGDPGYFGKCFKRMYGVAPSHYLVKS